VYRTILFDVLFASPATKKSWSQPLAKTKAMNSDDILRRSVADQVYEILKRDLRNGKLGQGEDLVEARVAKQLGVSRAPVREAVQRLSQDGLIQSTVGKSWKVRRLTASDIKNLYRVRADLECLAIQQACESDPEAATCALEGCIKIMRKAAARKNPDELAEAELDFHVELIRSSGNPYLVDLYSIVTEHVRLSFASLNMAYSDLGDVAEEHVPLIDLIREGNVAEAQSVLRKHIFSSLDEKLQFLELQ
jgi:DNA-binding GntR family transcriptional regulator